MPEEIDPRAMKPGWVLETVHSGGQTGVDQKGLEIAKWLGYKTGGVVPKGWRTDAGPAPWLGTTYGCTPHRVSSQYGPRTLENVRNTEATVLFYDESGSSISPGCMLTLRYCRQLNRQWLANPSVAELQDFIFNHTLRSLNIAGNRLRTFPESTQRAEIVLTRGLIPF